AAAVSSEIGASDGSEDKVRIYRTREERREAGLQRQLTPWLALSGLVELEYLYRQFSLHDTSDSDGEEEATKSLQLGLLFTPLPWMKAEVIYEYDDELNEHTIDEAIASFEARDFELEVGRQNFPFGEYFSHFVTGPALEFGETRHDGATLSYGPDDRLDLSGFVFKGDARSTRPDASDWDWGLALEASPSENMTFGLSYVSDLADAEEGLLEDEGNRHENRVDGLSAYALFGFDRFEVTAEVVSALDAFKELEADQDRPWAWNLELALFPAESFEWALRVEGSRELEDEPKFRAGVGMAWRVMKNTTLQVEYLRGIYERGLAEDNREREIDKDHNFGAMISVEF
ncbi:MAG: LbtU family siderophore porin, partial [Pseudomonadota bacterium]